MADATNKFQHGKIYKLIVGDDIYVGSTTLTLEERRDIHKANDHAGVEMRKLYDAIAKVGWEAVEIELVESYPCNTLQELMWRERHYYDIMQPTLNVNRPITTEQERVEKQQHYIKNNKERIAETHRLYYQKHIEVLKAKQRAYNETNKEAIKAQKAAYSEANKDVIKERKAAYCISNAAVIKEKRAAYREANREALAAKERARRAAKKS